MQAGFHAINDLFLMEYIESAGEAMGLLDKIFTFPEWDGRAHLSSRVRRFLVSCPPVGLVEKRKNCFTESGMRCLVKFRPEFVKLIVFEVSKGAFLL